MAILQLHNISGVEAIFTSTLNSAIAGSAFPSGSTTTGSVAFFTGNLGYTALSYDPAEDVVVLTNGREQNTIFNYLIGEGPGERVNRYPITHVAIKAASLDPGADNQELEVKAIASYHYPDSGGAFGFCYDYNTGRFYQQWWHYLLESSRYAKDTFFLGYGNNPPMPVTFTNYSVWTQAKGEYTQAYGDQVLSDTMIYSPGGFIFSPGLFRGPLGAIRFNDIAIMAYGDLNGQHNWLSVRKLGVGTSDDTAAWRGTRVMPFGPPFCIAPMGIDRCIIVWWANAQRDSPLVYTMYTFDRPSERLFLEDFGRVPTNYTYTWPLHKGYGTFDTKRGKLVLLSPNPNDLDAVVFDEFCHAGRPNIMSPPIPLDPYLAEQDQRLALATVTEATPQGAGTVTIAISGLTPINKPVTAGTDGVTGTGSFTIKWGSGTDVGTINLTTSTFSVGVSATYDQGVRYGEEALAILSTTATFTLSQTISAVYATSNTQAVNILPRTVTVASDAVGAGAPRVISYPTGALTSPIQYETNPQQWTNMGTNPLTRPLYASKKTLTKTATIQFVGDATDLEVREIWTGGGNRIAMSVSFFAALYDYYNNPPDFQNEGFITWEPRDLNSNAYKILITDLSVGGGGSIKLDNLWKAQEGWVHESVEMTIRLVGNA